MKARKLIEQASFGPETLKVIGQAFDEAWASIAGNFGDEPLSVEAARFKLADAVLASASAGRRDLGALKDAALQVLAREYKDKELRGARPGPSE